MMSKLPNFIVAGLPKCGTSSLYWYLKAHSEIYLPEQKEIHFFTDWILEKSTEGPGDGNFISRGRTDTISKYKTHYADVESQIAIGDCSPSYASYPECIPQILRTLGKDTKIIITLRNPIDRAYSNYLHLVRQGRETLEFREAFLAEDDRVKQGYGDFWRYKWNSLYFEKIKAFQQAFDHVKIIVFEDFVKNKEQFFDLLRFLNVSAEYDEDYLHKRFNEGGSYKSNKLVHFLNRESALKRSLKKIIPKQFKSNVLQVKNRTLNKYKTQTPKLSEDERSFLKSYFIEDVKKLNSELDINTSMWSDFN